MITIESSLSSVSFSFSSPAASMSRLISSSRASRKPTTSNMNAPAVSQSEATLGNPFAPTDFERSKHRRAVINKWIMFGFCLILVVPLVLILVDIFQKAFPVLSWHYLWDNPVNKGKEGGLWAPLVGTFYLVIGSLVF